jgi:hypothetical protein
LAAALAAEFGEPVELEISYVAVTRERASGTP